MADFANVLLGLIASLIGCGIWTVKALMARSDKLLQTRDEHVTKSLNHLGDAVKAFEKFEVHEAAVHTEILKGLENLNQSILTLYKHSKDSQ